MDTSERSTTPAQTRKQAQAANNADPNPSDPTLLYVPAVAWAYRNGTSAEGEVTYVDEEDGKPLAEDAPDCTPRPAPDVFARAQKVAAAAWRGHQTRCVRCGCSPKPCPQGAALARWAGDADQALAGTR